MSDDARRPAGAPAVSPAGPSAGVAEAAPGAPPPGAGAANENGGRRPRRSRTRWRAAFFALAGFAIVVGVGWALLGNRIFVVRSVAVTGTHLVTPAQVLAVADLPLGTPLMSVDSGAVSGRVETIQQVASATVTEDWPDHVVIAVTERVPVIAVRMANGSYDQVDAAGVVVLNTHAKPALPLFTTTLAGSALRGDPSVVAAAKVLTELMPALAKQVTQVRAAALPAGSEQVTLSLGNGKTIQWGAPGNAAQKNRELAVLSDTKARLIDVSAPRTVVTRLFSREMSCISPPGTPRVRGSPSPVAPVALSPG